MRVHLQQGHDNIDITFVADGAELRKLNSSSRDRVMALLRRGTVMDALEALAIIAAGDADIYDKVPDVDAFFRNGFDYDTVVEKMRQTIEDDAGDLWEKLHKEYGDYGPFQSTHTAKGPGPSPYSGNFIPAWAVTLGVPADASKDDIRAAYRKLAKQHHPDRGGDPVKFQLIKEAYEEGMK